MDSFEINRKIRLVAQGDADALALLYESLRTSVYGLALGILRDRGLAEDVMQTTFVKLQLNAGQFTREIDGKAWLMRIARNEAYDCLRKRREIPTDDLENTSGMPAPECDGEIERATDSLILREAMKVLDPDEHQIVFLHLFCDLKHKDVADLMGIPAGSAGRMYSEAIKKLRGSAVMSSLL